MKTKTIVTAGLLMPILLCAQPSFKQKVDAYIAPFVATKNFNGTVLVAQKGTILYLEAFGQADAALNVPNKADTKYHIASLSKSFTAAAILLLQEKKLLRVTDPITKYIPDYPEGDKITIHQLLTHTSGVPNINDMPEYDTISRFPQTPVSLLNVLRHKPLDFEPGAKYAYSNSNYNLLAYIIEKVSGKSYGEFITEDIVKPLQMTHTAHHGNARSIIPDLAVGHQSDNNFGLEKADYLDWSAKTGNGSLYSTAEDLYKWDRAMYPGKLLSKESLDKMFTVYAGKAGYGWFLDDHLGRKRIYFTGRSPGFSSYIGRYPTEEVCIIILANNYIPMATQLGSDIAAMLFGGQVTTPALWTTGPDPASIRAVVGQYRFDPTFYRPNMLMAIREKEGRLYTDWGELIPEGAMQYRDRVYWQDLHFVRDSTGKVTKLDYNGYIGYRQP
jgi:CubicO group peptidase (beta-lactamase class C family)